MNTAYLGNRPSRGLSIKFILAAAALAFSGLVAAPAALAQTPPAAPGPADTAAAPEGAPGKPKIEDAFNPLNVWNTSDEIGRGVIIIMIVMFAGTIYIAVTKVV